MHEVTGARDGFITDFSNFCKNRIDDMAESLTNIVIILVIILIGVITSHGACARTEEGNVTTIYEDLF